MWGTNQVCGYKIMRALSNFKTRITRKVFGVESKGTVEYEGDLKSGSRGIKPSNPDLALE
jgi:hypothetical protein